MTVDSLDHFRRKLAAERGLAPAAPVNDAAPRPAYEAFNAKDKTRRVDIHASDGYAHAVAYTYLVNVSYDYQEFRQIVLTVGGLVVKVTGERLKPIVDALKLNTCEFIQPYDAGRYAVPTDPEAPYVESIEVEVIRGVGGGGKKE